MKTRNGLVCAGVLSLFAVAGCGRGGNDTGAVDFYNAIAAEHNGAKAVLDEVNNALPQALSGGADAVAKYRAAVDKGKAAVATSKATVSSLKGPSDQTTTDLRNAELEYLDAAAALLSTMEKIIPLLPGPKDTVEEQKAKLLNVQPILGAALSGSAPEVDAKVLTAEQAFAKAHNITPK
jgi:hypothetical protein